VPPRARSHVAGQEPVSTRRGNLGAATGSEPHGSTRTHLSKEVKPIMVLRLDLRVGVLTDAKNNGTRGIRGFRQARASLRIKTLRPVCIGVL
jgi:hypothetical protein